MHPMSYSFSLSIFFESHFLSALLKAAPAYPKPILLHQPLVISADFARSLLLSSEVYSLAHFTSTPNRGKPTVFPSFRLILTLSLFVILLISLPLRNWFLQIQLPHFLLLHGFLLSCACCAFSFLSCIRSFPTKPEHQIPLCQALGRISHLACLCARKPQIQNSPSHQNCLLPVYFPLPAALP